MIDLSSTIKLLCFNNLQIIVLLDLDGWYVWRHVDGEDLKQHSKLYYLNFDLVNSLAPRDALWVKNWSTLFQLMACCLTAPSHYLNQFWLIMCEVRWYSAQSEISGNAENFSHQTMLWSYVFKTINLLLGDIELTHLNNESVYPWGTLWKHGFGGARSNRCVRTNMSQCNLH